MGLEESTLHAEEVEEILSVCPQYSTKEIKRLFKRFHKLDREQRGTISTSDVMHIPDFAMNPLSQRLLSVFASKEGLINFKDFTRALVVFHPNTPAMDKLRLLFDLYDHDGDGFVSRDDLLEVLRMATGKFLGEEKLTSIADEYLAGCDKLSFEQFQQIFPDMQAVHDRLTIRFSKGD